jgi:uncharacterized protein YbjT (DUF2867 family)
MKRTAAAPGTQRSRSRPTAEGATDRAPPDAPVLVTGATGYIGSRLCQALLEQGHRVRAMVRSPSRLEVHAWSRHPRLEVVAGDVDDVESLREALRDCRAAYYLIHRMQKGVGDFEEADRRAAQNFVAAADATPGLRQLIYLGGLGEGQGLSRHLKSRREVESVLRSGNVPLTALRAAMVIGAGSASFEIMRYLTERLPVMIAPKWLSVPCQPIAIRNAIGCLVGSLDSAVGKTVEIGGPEVLTYRRLIGICAQEMQLRRRLIIPVPLLTPRLSSYWIALVTPVPAAIARPLAEGLRNAVVCSDDRAHELFPQQWLSPRQAIRDALGSEGWAASGPGDPKWTGGTVLVDRRRRVVEASAQLVWDEVQRLGGQGGWPGANRLWQIRGGIDRALGGVGMRGRARDSLEPGDHLDFWRVEAVEPERLLRLRAEMRLPGTAVLEFHVIPGPEGTHLEQVAEFRPRGWAGILYWYALMPPHALVFRRMVAAIARRAERRTSEPLASVE